MTDQLTQQQVAHLVKLGADQFTGGDVAAFLRLAAGNQADLQAEAEGGPGPKPDQSQIEESAQAGGYLDNYLSLRAAGLKSEQAYFAAWYNAHPAARKPKTMRGVAKFLGRSHAVVYKWLTQDWFTRLGLNEWRRQLFVQNLADIDRKTISEAKELTGSAGVQARRLFYEIGLPALGLAGEAGSDGDGAAMPPLVKVYLPDNGR